MNSVEFILEQLKKLHLKFKNSNIRYEFNYNTAIHFIEVTPKDFYESDEYMECELNFEDNFYKSFPYEDLVFISEGSLNKITNPIFEVFSEKEGIFRLNFHENNSAEFSELFCYTENELMYTASDNEYALAA